MPAPLTARPRPGRLAAALCALLLAGCGGPESVDDLPPELRQFSVTSVRGSGPMPRSGSFAWHPGSRVVVDDERLGDRHASLLVQEALADALVARGYKPAGSPRSDLVVGFVVAVEDMDHASVSEAFGMDPGLLPGASGERYERGTLIVEISRPASPVPLWRGAVQARADLDLPETVRRERLALAVDRLFSGLTAGG